MEGVLVTRTKLNCTKYTPFKTRGKNSRSHQMEIIQYCRDFISCFSFRVNELAQLQIIFIKPNCKYKDILKQFTIKNNI